MSSSPTAGRQRRGLQKGRAYQHWRARMQADDMPSIQLAQSLQPRDRAPPAAVRRRGMGRDWREEGIRTEDGGRGRGLRKEGYGQRGGGRTGNRARQWDGTRQRAEVRNDERVRVRRRRGEAGAESQDGGRRAKRRARVELTYEQRGREWLGIKGRRREAREARERRARVRGQGKRKALRDVGTSRVGVLAAEEAMPGGGAGWRVGVVAGAAAIFMLAVYRRVLLRESASSGVPYLSQKTKTARADEDVERQEAV
ncbi:hypothetical protein DFH09DRAFT_1289994 [Mycena vulgaris]|nr:hypothetical protein DFH09DRAFT_1289994 [Mycena vulgaris]